MQTSSQSTKRVRTVSRIAGLLLVGALPAAVLAQGMRDLVEAALDQKIAQRIEITERPVRDALAELEKTTGVHFEVQTQALASLPYGAQTRIAIIIEDISVRRALERILAGLGLVLRVEENLVSVEPAPVLGRLGRRLTVEEAQLLQKLASQPWSAFKPDEVTVELRVTPRDPKDNVQAAFEQAMREGPPVDALTQLETALPRLGWQWVPSDKGIVVYGQAEDIQRRLDQPLDMSYQRVPLDKLLLDLGQRLGIMVHFEPGALQRVSARDRDVNLVQRGMTTRQVLELIAGNTGLWYEVVEDGVVIGSRQPGTSEPAPPGDRPPVVAILRIPIGTDGTTIDFLIRANELPEEFNQLRDRKMPVIIEELRKQLGT